MTARNAEAARYRRRGNLIFAVIIATQIAIIIALAWAGRA